MCGNVTTSIAAYCRYFHNNSIHKRSIKPKGKRRMANTKKPALLGTQGQQNKTCYCGNRNSELREILLNNTPDKTTTAWFHVVGVHRFWTILKSFHHTRQMCC